MPVSFMSRLSMGDLSSVAAIAVSSESHYICTRRSHRRVTARDSTGGMSRRNEPAQ